MILIGTIPQCKIIFSPPIEPMVFHKAAVSINKLHCSQTENFKVYLMRIEMVDAYFDTARVVAFEPC